MGKGRRERAEKKENTTGTTGKLYLMRNGEGAEEMENSISTSANLKCLRAYLTLHEDAHGTVFIAHKFLTPFHPFFPKLTSVT